MEIQHFAVVGESLKPVGKSFGNVEHGSVNIVQFKTQPLTKTWGSHSKIHQNIPNRAAQTSYEFHLGIRGVLKMQAANRTLLLRERLIDLDDGFVPARSGEFFDTEEACEEASSITNGFPYDDG